MLGEYILKELNVLCIYILIVLNKSKLIIFSLFFFTVFPDVSSPIINTLKVGFWKYQFKNPDIKENIFLQWK
jgi:hypothetical protein